VGYPFALLDHGSPGREGALVELRGTKPAAVGTGLFLRKSLGLLFEEELKGSFREPLSRGGGDLLHGSEIDIQIGPVFAEGSFGNNFPPLCGQRSELVEIFGCKS
jgi:hypothetical protein